MHVRLCAIAACVAAAIVPIAALGQAAPSPQTKAELDAAWRAAAKASINGPADVPLADEAHLKLAANEAFVPAAEANRLMVALGNTSQPGRLGLVAGRGKTDNWLVDVEWVKQGFVRDDDAAKWKPDEMLESLKQGTEQDNADRIARGIPALDVIGWLQQPSYDKNAHRLIWSLNLSERGAADSAPTTINYNTYALGREGYFSLDMITGSDTIDAEKPIAHQLLDSLSFAPGKRYQDFNGSTDKVAEYGLAALVGVVVAKKVGFLAVIGLFLVKAWKLGLLAIAAVAAAFRRFWRRRTGQDEAYFPEPFVETPVPEAEPAPAGSAE